jgi:hypothetical protein
MYRYEMPQGADATTPITDPDEAQRFDRSSRILRIALLSSGTFYLFVPAYLVIGTGVPLTVALLLALVGVVYTLFLVRYFARIHRVRLSRFVDPMTGELSIPNGRLPLPRKSRYALWVFVLAEAGALVLLARAGSPGSVPRPNVRFSTGQWTATGTILETQAVDARRGERIVRPWSFTRICEHRSCRTLFFRQTLYSREQTQLEAHSGRYFAAFPPETVPCPHYPGENAGTAEDYASFTLWWSANRHEVLALEHEHYVGRRCGGGNETIRWVARRTHPTARTPALGP